MLDFLISLVPVLLFLYLKKRLNFKEPSYFLWIRLAITLPILGLAAWFYLSQNQSPNPSTETILRSSGLDLSNIGI
jgi:hypothetical protein